MRALFPLSVVLLSSLLGAAACSPAPGEDAGPGPSPDAGGGPEDAGAIPDDAGPDEPDAGDGDAGAPLDAGPSADGGTSPDGGPSDGGLSDGGGADDGGPELDGGDADAGLVDLCASGCPGDHDIMLQAFYWDPPVDAANEDGIWWDHLRAELSRLRSVGITGLWVPSPAKGQFGIYDMGYGIYDPYDLGDYEQKGTVETRFGSRAELEAFLAAADERGVEVYADIVLNHIFTGDDNLEENPALTAYIASGAVVEGVERALFPTDEVLWSVPASPGAEVVVEVGGYRLPWDEFDGERAYSLEIISGAELGDAGVPEQAVWHVEGEVTGLSSGPVHGIIETSDDTDAFTVQATSAEVRLLLRSRRIGDEGPEPSSPQHGYRLDGATVNGLSAEPAALTRTRIDAVEHTGPGEAQIDWTWEHFHPSGPGDYLEGPGDDEVRPRWRVFGQDLDTFHPDVAATYQAWGAWLMTTVGFHGVRLDWVVGVQESYVKGFLDALPAAPEGGPRFAVGEYFSSRKDRISAWVEATDPEGVVGLQVFDFPLKFTLTDLANDDGAGFDIRALNTAGMVRDPTFGLPEERVVTFVENHDTGKEAAYWIERDHDLAHAFLLFAPERPCLFYKDLYAIPLVDNHDPSLTAPVPADLPQQIALLAAVRAHHLAGPLVSLSEVGNAFPPEDADDVWVGRRTGPAGKTGAALVINDDEDEARGLWVDTAPPGAGDSWAGRVLVDVTGQVGVPATVFDDGRAFLEAPPRSFTVWVPADEWDPAVVPSFEAASGLAEGELPE